MSRSLGGIIGLIGAILMLIPACLTMAGYISLLGYVGAGGTAIFYGLVASSVLALISALIALGGSIGILRGRMAAKTLIAGTFYT
ncbi:MAG: hypothetical protein ACXQTI_08160 [Candidatus Nezhaarchaeales archaeon]